MGASAEERVREKREEQSGRDLHDRLMDHVNKHHADMNDKWTPKWIIDTEGLYTNKNKPGVTRGNPYKAGIAKIYIHPSAFDSLANYTSL